MYYGIDIGGTKIELAAFNEKLEKLYKEKKKIKQFQNLMNYDGTKQRVIEDED